MSLYTQWINLIKEKADETWLTDSQREVYEAILSRWSSAPFVNLHGRAGAGKTFIARLLAKAHGYVYTWDLRQAPQGAKQVIVDNAEYSRLLRPLARSLRLGRVLLITNVPVEDTMPKVRLELNTRDVNQFCAVLSERCGISFVHTIPQGEDLAQILRQEVVARGEAHVTE